MGDLSKNFNRREFECHCGCGFDTVDFELVTVLEDVRAHFNDLCTEQVNIAIEITGPNRCPEHNRNVGGAKDSMHTQAKAVDIKVWRKWHTDQVDPVEVAEYLENKYPGKYGIGRYVNRTHIDVRPTRARWEK